MKKLYCVSTYYHTLISATKQLNGKDDGDILLLNYYIPDGAALFERIKKSGIFKNVFSEERLLEYTPKNKADFICGLHKKNKRLVSGSFRLDLDGYDEILVFHDDIWFSRYLKDMKIGYTLVEDSINCFQNIDNTPFSYMLQEKSIRLWLKKLINYGYFYFDRCDTIKCIEVNDGEGLRISYDKIKVVPRDRLFGELTADDRDRLKRVFLPSDFPAGRYDVLLLTQPITEDDICPSYDEQLKLYADILSEYGGRVAIKPHPRDKADYSGFKNVVLFPKNMPFEIVELCTASHFDTVVTLYSTAAERLRCADKKITLGREYILKQYHAKRD